MYFKMTPAWLCLLFTYFCTIYALEKIDNGNSSSEVKVEETQDNPIRLENLGPFNFFSTVLGSVVPGNGTNKSVSSLEVLLQKVKLPESSITKKIVNATDLTFLRNSFSNPIEHFFKGVFSKPLLRTKREDNPLREPLNVDQNLPINRLLDATDKLFNQTAFIDTMLDKKEQGDNSVLITNRDLIQDHSFNPIYKKNDAKEASNRYSSLLGTIFKTPYNSEHNFVFDIDQSHHNLAVNDEDQLDHNFAVIDVDQSGINQENQQTNAIFLGNELGGPNKNHQGLKLKNRPLVNSGLFLIDKIKNLCLNVMQKLRSNKNTNGKIFAISALTSFTLAVGISAANAFYTLYGLCEKICRILTGRSDWSDCNLLNFICAPFSAFKGVFSKISDLLYFGKSLTTIPKPF